MTKIEHNVDLRTIFRQTLAKIKNSDHKIAPQSQSYARKPEL
jgi:hypothetical protein